MSKSLILPQLEEQAAYVTDGLSNTTMISKAWGRTAVDHDRNDSSRGMNLHTAVYLDWTPNSNRTIPWKSNSFHGLVVHMAFGDGPVRFVGDTIELRVFQAMATIDGAAVVAD